MNQSASTINQQATTQSQFVQSPVNNNNAAVGAQNATKDVAMLRELPNLHQFNESGPQARLSNLVKLLEPIFFKVLSHEQNRLDELYHSHQLKIKNLEEVRRNPDSTEITYIDYREAQQQSQDDGARDKEIAVLQDKKKSMRFSSSQAFQKRWQEIDKEMKQSFMHQLKEQMRQVFSVSCRELLVQHPMFESALSQIMSMEESTQRKLAQVNARNREQAQESQTTFKEAIVNVSIDLSSYKQFSGKVQEVIEKYESQVKENANLRDRMNRLIAQYDTETSIRKQYQKNQADKDLQMLQLVRLKRNNRLVGKNQYDKTDEMLDEDKIESKIVEVDFFNALEGKLDEELQKELNYKLANVRNQFQELLEQNLQTVEKLENKIKLMNQLSPDAYSVANLSLIEIFKGCAMKESDPARIWKALKNAYGDDYFVKPVEEQYGRRFVANYNALYSEVKKVRNQADNEIAKIEEASRNEVQAQKRLVEDLRFQLSLFRESFKTQVDDIQFQTKVAMEKDFEQRESRLFQKQLQSEQQMQKEIEEREELCRNAKKRIEKEKVKMFFDRLKVITMMDKFQKLQTTGSSMLNSVKIEKISQQMLGFLRLETTTLPMEIEAKMTERIGVLEHQNNEVMDQNQKLEFQNTMLEDQIKLLDAKVYETGSKVSIAENKSQLAQELQRKAVHEVTSFKVLNENYENIIESHEREKQSLLNDLKKYTRGKVRSNIYQAEIYRKEQQSAVIKRSREAVRQIYTGVEAEKGVQTSIVGLKGHVVHLSDKEYYDKFCKQFTDAEAQTNVIELFQALEMPDSAVIRNNMTSLDKTSSARSKHEESSTARKQRRDSGINRTISHPARQSDKSSGKTNSIRGLEINALEDVNGEKSGRKNQKSGKSSVLPKKMKKRKKSTKRRNHIDDHLTGRDNKSGQSQSNTTSSNSSQSSPSIKGGKKQKTKGRPSKRGTVVDGATVIETIKSEKQLQQSNNFIPYHNTDQSDNRVRTGIGTESPSPAMVKRMNHHAQNERNEIEEEYRVGNGKDGPILNSSDPRHQKYHLSTGEIISNQGSQTISIGTKMNPLFLSQRGVDSVEQANEANSINLQDDITRQVSQEVKIGADGSYESRRATAMTQLFRGQQGIQNIQSKNQLKKRQMQQAGSSYGWKIIQERLQEIEALEARHRSQIKYEVDKAFEMAKYLEETKLAKRDPQTSQAYSSIIQMCMNRVDRLTPKMIVQKLEQEQTHLQQLLTVDAHSNTKAMTKISRILNFVCLENLNKQIVKIFKSALNNIKTNDGNSKHPKSSIQVQLEQSKECDESTQQKTSGPPLEDKSSTNRASQLLHQNLSNNRPVEIDSSFHGYGSMSSTLQLDKLRNKQFRDAVSVSPHSPETTSMQQVFNQTSLPKRPQRQPYRSKIKDKRNTQEIKFERHFMQQPRQSMESYDLTNNSQNNSSSNKHHYVSSSLTKQQQKQSFQFTANQGVSESTPSQISLVRKIMNHHGALINGQQQQQHRNNKINSFIEVANSQKIVEARIAAARRFNSVGFQSLLTSSQATNKVKNAKIAPRTKNMTQQTQMTTDSHVTAVTESRNTGQSSSVLIPQKLNLAGVTNSSSNVLCSQQLSSYPIGNVNNNHRNTVHLGSQGGSGTRSNLFKFPVYQTQQSQLQQLQTATTTSNNHMVLGSDFISHYTTSTPEQVNRNNDQNPQQQPQQLIINHQSSGGSIIGPNQFAQIVENIRDNVANNNSINNNNVFRKHQTASKSDIRIKNSQMLNNLEVDGGHSFGENNPGIRAQRGTTAKQRKVVHQYHQGQPIGQKTITSWNKKDRNVTEESHDDTMNYQLDGMSTPEEVFGGSSLFGRKGGEQKVSTTNHPLHKTDSGIQEIKSLNIMEKMPTYQTQQSPQLKNKTGEYNNMKLADGDEEERRNSYRGMIKSAVKNRQKVQEHSHQPQLKGSASLNYNAYASNSTENFKMNQLQKTDTTSAKSAMIEVHRRNGGYAVLDSHHMIQLQKQATATNSKAGGQATTNVHTSIKLFEADNQQDIGELHSTADIALTSNNATAPKKALQINDRMFTTSSLDEDVGFASRPLTRGVVTDLNKDL